VIREPSEIFDLGRFDLVICKDVLIHVPNSIANEYLDVFAAVARYALITVDAFPSDRINEDSEIGDYRAIDIRKPPFSRNTSIIAEYVNFQGIISSSNMCICWPACRSMLIKITTNL
jgi:hypothetical protein